MKRNLLEDSRGFSLVEVMVALVVTSLVVVAVYTTMFRSQRAAQSVTAVVEHRQGARAAVQLLERDLRMAGSGWGRLTVSGSNNGAQLNLRAVMPGYGGSAAASDSVVIVGGFDLATTLRAAMTTSAPSSLIKVTSAAGFAVGDLCVVTDGDRAHLFQITKVEIPPHDLEHATTSTFNVGGGHGNWPTGGYKSGSQVYRAAWISYRMDTTSFRRPSLVRQQFGSPQQLVAYDVLQFHTLYQLQDGSVTRNPVDLSMIERVRPVIRTSTTLPDEVQVADSSAASVRPRAF